LILADALAGANQFNDRVGEVLIMSLLISLIKLGIKSDRESEQEQEVG
jgi:hypothetical protein